MTELSREERFGLDLGLESNLERLDADLSIMETHSTEMDRVEDRIQEEMRKWDREHKDAHFHSVPKPRKHLR